MISHLERLLNPYAFKPLHEMSSCVEEDIIPGVPMHIVRFIQNKKAYYIKTNYPREVYEALKELES